MWIVHRRADGDRELELSVDRRQVSVGELAAALGESGSALVIDGRPVGADLALSETPLVAGSVVSGSRSAAPDGGGRDRSVAVTETPAATLVTVAGLDAGRRTPLPRGTSVVGRRPNDGIELMSPTVSVRHARLRVSGDGRVAARDLGSRNGTWLGDQPVGGEWVTVPPGAIVRFGGVCARIEPADGDRRDRPTTLDPVRHGSPAGRIPFNRPPRPAHPASPSSVRLPRPPNPQGSRPALAILRALLPAVAGLITVVVTGNWLFALLPLLSPVVAIGGWWQARRSAGRAGRREHARFIHDLQTARVSLLQSLAEETARRRAVLPDLGEVTRRAHQPSSRLWERRPADADWLHLNGGIATTVWSPPQGPLPDPVPEEMRSILAGCDRLFDCPVDVDLSRGGVVGIVGTPAVARDLARSLVAQAVVHHGPADLAVFVAASGKAAADWAWCRWLPHVAVEDGPVRTEAANVRLRSFLSGAAVERSVRHAGAAMSRPVSPAGSPLRLVVIDHDELLSGPRAPARAVLRGDAGPVAGIVVAASADRLPASCTTVIELSGEDGRAVVRRPAGAEPQPADDLDVLVCGLSEPAARQLARALARLEDGDQTSAAGLTRHVRLLELLGHGDLDCGFEGAAADSTTAGWVARRWGAEGQEGTLAVPLGVTADGPLMVDLVADGPHALVAGTTGAGKSELLRSWVAGLAATVHPEQLNFVLIDYKGGSAFDQCGRLPHTVAVVTDLDESLAERALRCLEAELRYRESCLRELGVADLDDYRRARGARPALPRLVVMVDEFATLAAELPGFLDALVGVAQRGRSLGVHLVLATQRPAGVVGDNIRANTALRVALRVQDRDDSLDVIGGGVAAELPREIPGRAIVRFGPGELVEMQAALVSGRPSPLGTAIDVRPLRSVPDLDDDHRPPPTAGLTVPPDVLTPARPDALSVAPTDLVLLVDAAVQAAAALGISPPRTPWPPALPAVLLLEDLEAYAPSPDASRDAADLVKIFLVDDPDRQRQYVGGWYRTDGNFLIVGPVGSGTTTALATAAVSLTRGLSPGRVQFYVVDGAGGALEPLGDLPHCGGVVRLGDEERLVRLIHRLCDELDVRRSMDPQARSERPDVVLLIDGWSALQAELERPGQLTLGEELARVICEGPDVGLRTVIAADRSGAVRPRIDATMTQRLVLGSEEGPAAARNGRASSGPGVGSRERPPGRGVDSAAGLVVQVALPAEGADLALPVGVNIRRWSAHTALGPRSLGRLPTLLDIQELLVDACPASGEPWVLPIGLRSSDLATTGWTIHGGDHVLITGPARSGRSTTLRATAVALRHCRPDVALIAVAPRRSPLSCEELAGHVAPEELGGLAAWVERGPTAILIDDAETVEDPSGQLTQWIEARRPDVLVVAAARNDAVRSQYGSWLRRLRPSRLGLLLQPDAEADGDVMGVRLPRRPPAALSAGRGYLVDGSRVEYVQVAAAGSDLSSLHLPKRQSFQ